LTLRRQAQAIPPLNPRNTDLSANVLMAKEPILGRVDMPTQEHWMKPLAKLFDCLQKRFGGEVVWPEEKPLAREGALTHPTPFLRGTFRGAPIEIELLTEHELHFHVLGATPSYFEIWPAQISDRLQWHLGVSRTALSGSSEFDHRFNTNLLFQDSAGFLKIAEVQQLIESLEPFVYLHVHHNGILMAKEVHQKEVEAVDEVERVLVKLVELLGQANRLTV
jgi:hypothetical protein